MLRLLADENIPRQLITHLRGRHHDVRWILEENKGLADPLVLANALAERRVLLTCDKDFGDIVFREGAKAACGVILIRLFDTRSQTEIVQIVSLVLEAHESSWEGHFSVIDRRRVRVMPLSE